MLMIYSIKKATNSSLELMTHFVADIQWGHVTNFALKEYETTFYTFLRLQTNIVPLVHKLGLYLLGNEYTTTL